MNWTGVNFLLVLIYGSITVLLVAIFVKRLVHRVRLSLKFSHQQIDVGSGGTKKLIDEINKGLDDALHFVYEPKLLLAGDKRIFDGGDEGSSCNYIHRMKTVDSFPKLDNALVSLNAELHRPMGKSVRQHLLDVKSHSSGCLRSVRTNQLQTISDLYMHARYGPEPFRSQDHDRFLDLTADVVSIIRQRSHVKKKTKEKRKELHRQHATSIDDETLGSSNKEQTLASSIIDSEQTLQTSFATTILSGANVDEERSASKKASEVLELTDMQPLLEQMSVEISTKEEAC